MSLACHQEAVHVTSAPKAPAGVQLALSPSCM